MTAGNPVRQTSLILAFVLLAGCAVTRQVEVPVSALPEIEAQRLLQLHNRDRRLVGVAPLVWSPTLSAYAQEWADHLGGNGCRMEHRPGEGKWAQQYGENLFIGTAAVFGVDDGYGIWAAEQLFYDEEPISEENIHRIGHYTQIVWRDTREVGCAKAYCKDMMLLVCNYAPAGNLLDERPY